MRPVTISTDVPQERSGVYAFLDVMANHEAFTDHMPRDPSWDADVDVPEVAEQPDNDALAIITIDGLRVVPSAPIVAGQ